MAFPRLVLAGLPIILGLVAALMLISSYVFAVLRGDVSPLFPYISDTGGDVPESCIFGQLLNILALLVFIGSWLRYKQVKSMNVTVQVEKLNKISIYICAFAALGGSIVANFQDTNVISVHMTGALMLFVLGILYCILQSIISYKINDHCNRMWMCHLRLIITLVAAVFLVTCIIAGNIASAGWKQHHIHKTYYHWGPEDGGYAAHLVSAFSEWIMSFALLSFYVTFFPDFWRMQLHVDLFLYQNPFQIITNWDQSMEGSNTYS